MFDKTPVLNETRGEKGVATDHQSWSKTETVGQSIRLVDHGAGQFQLHITEQDFIADLDAEPFQQKRRGDGAIGVAVPGQKFAQRSVRRGHESSIERVGAVNGLHFRQGLFRPIGKARHGTQPGGNRDGTKAVEIGPFLLRRLPVAQLETDVSGEDRLAFGGYGAGDCA